MGLVKDLESWWGLSNGYESLLLQPRHPLPRIRHFREAGNSGLLRVEKHTNRRLRKIMNGPNLAETTQCTSLSGFGLFC